jgi:hypothetical protein
MKILRQVEELAAFLVEPKNITGCLADTGFLYGFAYLDDRLHAKASEVFDLLADREVGIFANVISRLEFVDLIFRKQVTLGAIQLFEGTNPKTAHQNLYRLLKDIRDKDTFGLKNKQSFKVSEGQLKKLRKELTLAVGARAWKNFCDTYVGEMLKNEWSILEQDLGLNFIEIMEGATSGIFTWPLLWGEMVEVMGNHGIRGPDAMIVNLFSKSNLPLLITGDSDFEVCFSDPTLENPNKAVFLLS